MEKQKEQAAEKEMQRVQKLGIDTMSSYIHFIVIVGVHVLQSMRTLAPLHSRVNIPDLPGTVSAHCCACSGSP